MVRGEVKLNGDDRNIAVCKRPFIGVLALVLVYKFAGEPIIIAPLWAGALVKILHPLRIGLSADLDALYFAFGQFLGCLR